MSRRFPHFAHNSRLHNEGDDDEEEEEEQQQHRPDHHHHNNAEHADNGEHEEEEDDDETLEEAEFYQRAMEQLFRMAFRSRGGGSGGHGGGGSGGGGGALGGISAATRATTTTPGSFGTARSNPNVTGTRFEDSIFAKHRSLHRDKARAATLFDPISQSGSFLMRPNAAHCVSAADVRMSKRTESAADAVSEFWTEYEDTLDDALLNIALAAGRCSTTKTPDGAHLSGIHHCNYSINNATSVLDQEKQKLPLAVDESSPSSVHSTPTTPRHLDPAATSGKKEGTPPASSTTTCDDASATPQAAEDGHQHPQQQHPQQEEELDYSPWAGPSPYRLEALASSSPSPAARNNNNGSSALPTSSSATAGDDAAAALLPSRTAAQTAATQSCLAFLRSAPTTLPSTCRGVVRNAHILQPISGFAVSTDSPGHGDSSLVAIGSRAGKLVVGSLKMSEWKAKLRALETNDVTTGGEQLQRNPPDERRRNNIAFPLESLEQVRGNGSMVFDTAWHPTLPMYAACGGSPDVVVGFAGEHLELDDDDDMNILSSQHASSSSSVVDSNSQQQQQQKRTATTTKPRNLLVDIGNNQFRSYVFSCAWFGSNSVVAACSGGQVKTIKVAEAGNFVVDSHPVHGEDINGVCRFGANPASPLFVTGSDDRRVALCDERVPEGSVQFGKGHTNGVMSVAARGDDFYFASVGKDQTIKLWDVRKMSSVTTFMGARRSALVADGDDDADDDSATSRFSRWNHYAPPQTAPMPSHLKIDHSVSTFPNANRFVQTLCRVKFSPMSTTGGRYLLVGGCGAAHVVDIVRGAVVARLRWDDSSTADDVSRDVAWMGPDVAVVCTYTAAHVFCGF